MADSAPADTAPAAALPPDAALARGQVIERVRCLADARQSYALYLPSSYDAGRRWPILYAFDPGARGAVPVRLFAPAAEKLGFIVVASNNSRNGPLPPVVAAIEAVWVDTHRRLAIDAARVYATGMSGGNMPALLVAANQGAGIIACAGAFEAKQIPKSARPLAWLGIAGDADFNFDLTKAVVTAMVARGSVARFASFEGGHAWPPEELAARALEWLDLAAMRDGTRPREASRIEQLRQQGIERAQALMARGEDDSAAEEYAALARELAGLGPVEALTTEARRLRTTPAAKAERKKSGKLRERTRAMTEVLLELRTEIELAVDPAQGVRDASRPNRDLDSRLARLRQDLEAKEPETRILARRVLDGFYVATFYDGRERRGERRFEAALADFEICGRMRPEAFAPVYEQARTYAARGARRRALAVLERAVDLGFSDSVRLVEDPEWSALRERPEYQALRSRLPAPPE